MRIVMMAATLALAATAVSAAPTSQGAGQCPMCGRMLSGQASTMGAPGGGMMGPMMGPQMMRQMMQSMMLQRMAGPATVAVAGDGSVYVVRGGMLYKYDANLNLVAQARLPAHPMPGAAPAQAGSTGDGHQEHH